MKKFRYVISYNFIKDESNGSGNCTIVRKKPIRTYSDKLSVEDSIKKPNGFSSVVIMSIFELAKQ